MGTRKKINVAHINGCLIFAGLTWFATGWWGLALVVLVVLIVGCLHSGEIRPRRTQNQRRRSQ